MRLAEIRPGDLLVWGRHAKCPDWWLVVNIVPSETMKSQRLVLHGYSFRVKKNDVIMIGRTDAHINCDIFRSGILLQVQK